MKQVVASSVSVLMVVVFGAPPAQAFLKRLRCAFTKYKVCERWRYRILCQRRTTKDVCKKWTRRVGCAKRDRKTGRCLKWYDRKYCSRSARVVTCAKRAMKATRCIKYGWRRGCPPKKGK